MDGHYLIKIRVFFLLTNRIKEVRDEKEWNFSIFFGVNCGFF